MGKSRKNIIVVTSLVGVFLLVYKIFKHRFQKNMFLNENQLDRETSQEFDMNESYDSKTLNEIVNG